MKTFYIETFGCQMNAHDSEKVVGTLVAKGYRRWRRPEDAELVLYNTCSIRDKAEQKVFHRLQQFKRDAARARSSACWGAWRSRRARRSSSGRRTSAWCAVGQLQPSCREMLVQLEAGDRRVTGLSLDTDETFETPFTRRDNPHRAYITIIEGCDKSCAYCVVPFTRGPERSRTSASVMAEARELAARGYTRDPVAGAEREQLPRSVAGGLGFRATAAGGGRSARHSARALHHVASARFRARHRGRHRGQSGAVQSRASAGAIRIDGVLGRDAAAVHARGVPAADRVDEIGEAGDRHHHRHHRRLSGRDGRGLRGDAGAAGRGGVRFAVQLQVLAAAEYAGAGAGGSDSARKRRRGGWRSCKEQQRAIQIRRNAGWSARWRMHGGGINQATGQWIGRTSQHQTLNFTHAAMPRPEEGTSLLGTYLPVRVTRAGPNSLAGEACAERAS